MDYHEAMNLVTFASHVGIALLCGLIIGFERQWRQHPAGLRTNALVSVGACMFASLALLFDDKESSPTRVAGQIVTGVGFLAGGVILRDGMNVKGLTTAATIWCTGAIGTLAGCGFMLYAFFSTCCVLFLNIVMHPLSYWLDAKTLRWKSFEQHYQLIVNSTTEQSSIARSMIVEYFQCHPNLSLQSILQRDGASVGLVQIVGHFIAKENCDERLEGLMGIIQRENGVNEVRWERIATEPSA